MNLHGREITGRIAGGLFFFAFAAWRTAHHLALEEATLVDHLHAGFVILTFAVMGFSYTVRRGATPAS